MAQKKVPSAAKIKTAESGIAKIKSGLLKLATILTGNRQKLMAMKSRLRTPEQVQKYTVLARAQMALESATKTQAARYKVLAGTMNKLKGMFVAIAKGATDAARNAWETAKKPVSWLMSKLKKKPAGVSNIESIDDLGAIPMIAIWGVVVATIAVLSAAIGYLISRASALDEQIDAQNEDLDDYEDQIAKQQLSQRSQAPAEDDFSYEDDYEEEF